LTVDAPFGINCKALQGLVDTFEQIAQQQSWTEMRC
jgi:hypothetical protein